MSVSRDDIIAAVALRMDEITPSSGISSVTVDGSDNNPLAVLIGGLIDDCMMEIFNTAPYWRLPWTALDTKAKENISAPVQRTRIRLRVPNDFLRIAIIKVPGFQRPITEVYPEQSEMGKRQHNPHLIAKTAKPVAVFSHGSWTTSGGTGIYREIDCYSLEYGSSVTTSDIEASYIKKPASSSLLNWDAETVVTLPLIPALEWLIASKAFAARGDTEHAAICLQNAQNLLV